MEIGFSRLRTQGYRRLRDLDLPLGSFNVLIGANGVGKSSVLEVMSLLAASASGKLQETVSSSGGSGASSRLDESGCTVTTRASEFDLDRWLADYSLDQLWSMGRLGGRS